MSNLSCAFIGCHPTRFHFKYKENYSLCKKIKAALLEQAKIMYKTGVRRFYIGGALGVDMWAGELLISMKESPAYKDIEIICVIPFEGHDGRWDTPSKRRFAKLLSGCDKKIVAGKTDQLDAHKARSYYMIDCSECLIAVYDDSEKVRSATSQAINYARKRGLKISFIHPDTSKIIKTENKK